MRLAKLLLCGAALVGMAARADAATVGKYVTWNDDGTVELRMDPE
jgi:hypothetical protein